MEGAIGIKTGFTGDAGYCFVGALEREEKKFVSVVLGSGWPPNKNWKWKDTRTLMEYGLDDFCSKDLEKKLTYTPLPVVDGVKTEVEVYVEKKEPGELVLLLSEMDETAITKEMQKEIKAPVQEGDVVGYECYYVNNKLYKKYEIRTAESVELRTYFYCLRQVSVLYF
jgi:D-alanyl-D-alanine carboxypeptidase (penicillin-binding protein 5/6)